MSSVEDSLTGLREAIHPPFQALLSITWHPSVGLHFLRRPATGSFRILRSSSLRPPCAGPPPLSSSGATLSGASQPLLAWPPPTFRFRAKAQLPPEQRCISTSRVSRFSAVFSNFFLLFSSQAANQLKGNNIREGQVLHLPSSFNHRRGGATSTR